MIKKRDYEPPSTEGALPTRIEKKQVEERIAITANVVYEAIRREGDEELHRPAAALAWSAPGCGTRHGNLVCC
jgi:formate-nitrite transporter family protein